MAALAIEATGLQKRFGDVHAVRGLDLQVKSGEVFGLLGPNGAGKTTSLEMLEGLVQPDAGEIRILGLDWRKQGAAIRNRIGVQFQSTQLDDKVKVREALEMFGCYYAKSRKPADLLRLLQLEDKAEVYQSKLSGGQRQRLALGLALVNEPELVFLDEPTTGLDPQARQGLWDLVRQLKSEGRTVLLTTHYMDEAEALCDRIGIMDHGQILQLGTPRELIASLNQPSYAEIEFQGSVPNVQPFAERLGMHVEVKAQHWAVPLTDPKRDLQQLLSCVEALDLPMQQLHVRRASLEDVFLQRTGRSLRD
ncbi:ABC transporter ATP-binding protein [Solimicrobium silvestre]|uniref:ABC-type multidrug transport system ATPase component n=1 Tax=Solimicrobium silvestre TaxID=2099400 RepID=A0A2S9H5H9_9BURK|nr:ABC transporter ATP-binding protein [Solimicrobium silvestre]PRC95244.1 ABC-type multidrug transport system ATPase component [Solimicrobium silvestre]